MRTTLGPYHLASDSSPYKPSESLQRFLGNLRVSRLRRWCRQEVLVCWIVTGLAHSHKLRQRRWPLGAGLGQLLDRLADSVDIDASQSARPFVDREHHHFLIVRQLHTKARKHRLEPGEHASGYLAISFSRSRPACLGLLLELLERSRWVFSQVRTDACQFFMLFLPTFHPFAS